MANSKAKKNDTAANLGFEAKLWQAADALRNNMDAAEYKHVVLGLIGLAPLSWTPQHLREGRSHDAEEPPPVHA